MSLEGWQKAIRDIDTIEFQIELQKEGTLDRNDIAALINKVKELEKDAARWKHIRREDVEIPHKIMSAGGTSVIKFLHGEELDAAVDKDMSNV
jgi:hypothetical protein